MNGRLHTRYAPVRRSPTKGIATSFAAPRLACVRPAASVYPEPGSNSPLSILSWALPLEFNVALFYLYTPLPFDVSSRKHLGSGYLILSRNSLAAHAAPSSTGIPLEIPVAPEALSPRSRSLHRTALYRSVCGGKDTTFFFGLANFSPCFFQYFFPQPIPQRVTDAIFFGLKRRGGVPEHLLVFLP